MDKTNGNGKAKEGGTSVEEIRAASEILGLAAFVLGDDNGYKAIAYILGAFCHIAVEANTQERMSSVMNVLDGIRAKLYKAYKERGYKEEGMVI